MLPTIADYPLPTRAELPANRVDWTIDATRAVLLVHDMQAYFLDAFGPSSALTKTVADNIAQLRDAARAHDVPVYFTAQPPTQRPEDRGLLWDFWGPGIQGDGRHRIVEALQPVPDEQLITKWRYDGFLRTDLEERIRRDGRDQLIITGVYAHIGCLATATSAFMRDIQPFLIADGLADFSAGYHASAVKYAAERCAVVLDTESALAQLGNRPG